MKIISVEATAQEINETSDTLRALGISVGTGEGGQVSANGSLTNISHINGHGGWNESKARKFLKDLDEYPSHKKLFYTIYDAELISYEDLMKQTKTTSDELKAKLASITKITHRYGRKELRSIDWKPDTFREWEVDPSLRKIIEENKIPR